MKIHDPRTLMFEILALKQEINRLASTIIKTNYSIFEEHSLPIPVFTPSELGFLRAASWLYVLYYEVGHIHIEFLTEKFSAYKLDEEGKIIDHLETVQQMRTFLQHNLDPRKERNRRIQEACEIWFDRQCNTGVPSEDRQWRRCLISFLQEAILFLTTLNKCIREIEQDESRNQIVDSWNLRLTRHHPPHEFDELIALVAADMGRENIDPVRLRKRFYDKWTKDLALYQGNYEFNIEGRKLIEYALLVETTSVLPITGKDLLQEFSLIPGPQIGELLKEAQLLHNAEPCSREILLERLRQKMEL